jgi:hypothetical protein
VLTILSLRMLTGGDLLYGNPIMRSIVYLF